MRLNEIKHSWRPWQDGQDNTDANIDIPLEEGIDMANPNDVIKGILATKDENFGPAMTLEEALAWARR
jgi:acetoin utilization deacetylase AcuC-like enzyme